MTRLEPQVQQWLAEFQSVLGRAAQRERRPVIKAALLAKAREVGDFLDRDASVIQGNPDGNG